MARTGVGLIRLSSQSFLREGHEEVDLQKTTGYDAVCEGCYYEVLKLDPYYGRMTEAQKEALVEVCPACGYGRLHGVPSPDDEDAGEIYLWCNNCDLSMDGGGGYVA
ncbi:MAG: hypothetical protein JWM68_4946 [Verrucomicrobiales bacterium]|nr:hypothetical protein [Verrucomicrobiales bacterium]